MSIIPWTFDSSFEKQAGLLACSLVMIEPSRHRLVKLNSCLTQWSKRSQTVDRAADWSLQQRVLPRIFTVFPVRKIDFTRFSAAKIHKIL